jgi:tetratricopeptide (TPR) repeat protein
VSDWYRRSRWSDQAAADFEARLGRSRPSSRAQYLSLQGYALLASEPAVAEALLRRAVDLVEPSELPRAACYLALARLAQGNVDGAIAAYDGAIAAERRNPAFRSSAAVDQALLIAAFRKTDRYADALDRLFLAGSGPLGLVEFEAAAAEALIRAELREFDPARVKAREALATMPDDAAEAAWGGISMGEIERRLQAIV